MLRKFQFQTHNVSSPRRAVGFCIAALSLTVFSLAGSAAINLSTSSTYEQNFDSLGVPATATTVSTLPADFKADTLTTVRAVGTFGAAATTVARDGGANLSTTAANGSYNFGAGTAALGNSDRSVGFLSSGTATASGNLYAQLANNTGGTLSGVQIAYNVEKYRGGSNAAGFRVQLFYSTDGTTWTTAGNNFLTSFVADASNAGFATAPGASAAVSNTLSVSIPNGANLYLAWNYSVASGTTTTNAQALAIDDVAILGLACAAQTNPSGTGAANPNTVQAGSPTLLTVAVTPGTNPPSTGLGVTADLTAIGGSATQQLFDDGSQGDASPGDNIFSFQATVSAGTAPGSKSLLASIADAQSRNASASISLTVTAASPPPTGAGSANPGSVLPGNSTLLTVMVTPGSSPPSSGLTVTGDLSSIGGSSTQQFFDNGTNGDAVAGNNVFSFLATVGAGTAPGLKSLPVTVADAELRSTNTSIALTIQSPPPPNTVKISQVYGGGGNSGSTYTNDFIELFNQSNAPVDISTWSVQYISGGITGAWAATNLCATSCIIQPGHYYLVQEGQGLGGTTALPAADISGSIPMGSGSGKIALVANTTPLNGGCPTDASVVDLVAYGTTNCSISGPGLDNTTAALRKGNGCIDTDNNAADFIAVGPIPRNAGAPPNFCGGNPAQISGLGVATPGSFEAAGATLLTVAVTPATSPASTGLTVTASLSAIGGDPNQTFYDDGTHGDVTPGDNIFSFRITTAASITTGAKYLVAAVSDGQGRSVNVPITLTIQSPTCGVERWSVKTGTDPDSGLVNLSNITRSTINDLRNITAPATPPDNARVQPTETTVYNLNGIMTVYKKETDVDYHVVIQDSAGRTMIVEIPSPACVGAGSPFLSGVSSARTKFDAKLNALENFQTANIPVQVKGVAFFDFIHGQTGVAPNGIELHPLLDINFPVDITSQLTVTTSGFVYSPVTKLYGGTITVKNNGAAADGPVSVVLSNLTAGVTVQNPAGTFGGDPYFAVTTGTTGISAGQSISIPVKFSNPSNSLIQMSMKVYSGPLN